jgi:hypothetical protein
MLLIGSHMWYSAAYYSALAVDPRSRNEASDDTVLSSP